MRRVLLGGLMAVFVIAGCGRAPGPQASGAGYTLYEAASSPGSELVAVINTRSHGIERQLPLGTMSADWKHLYAISNGRTLADIDPRTGATLHSLRLPGTYLLPPAAINGLPGGLSQNGRWLVVQGFNDIPNGQPTETHMMLVDTTYSKPAVPIDLHGFYEFDAVSNDGLKVYLIQYASAGIYRVRVYDVGVGLNPNVVFDKSDGGDAMTGVRLSGVPSPDGQWLFSVYARENASPFVHALNLDSGIAFCLDLPGSGYATSAAATGWSLALSVDGTHLYAANGKLGLVTQIYNPADGVPTVERTFALGQGATSASGLIQDVEAKEIGMGGAVLSADGRTLVVTGAAGLLWVDTYTMQTSRHELDGWLVSSLALSPDGKMLYAVNDSGMIAELSMAGGAGTKFAGAPGQPLALVRVEAAPATP